jgi:hypothetical protein
MILRHDRQRSKAAHSPLPFVRTNLDDYPGVNYSTFWELDDIKEHLTEEIIGKIRFKTLRGRELCITPLFVIPVKTGIQEVVNIAGYRRSCPLGYSQV